MKKAKIILASVALLAIIAGILSFKASRFQQPNIWYIPADIPNTLTSTTVSGFTYVTTIPNCTLNSLATTNMGSLVNTSTSTTSPMVVTVFTRLSAGQQVSYTTTYRYCTLTIVRTTIADI